MRSAEESYIATLEATRLRVENEITKACRDCCCAITLEVEDPRLRSEVAAELCRAGYTVETEEFRDSTSRWVVKW